MTKTQIWLIAAASVVAAFGWAAVSIWAEEKYGPKNPILEQADQLIKLLEYRKKNNLDRDTGEPIK